MQDPLSFKTMLRFLFIPLFVVISASSLYSKTAGHTQKISVAVLPIKKNNVPQFIANSIRNTVEYRFTSSRSFNTLERHDIQLILNENKLISSNQKKTSTILNADYFVSGSVIHIGYYELTLKVISGTDGSILFVYKQTYKDKLKYTNAIDMLFKKIKRDIIGHAKNIAPVIYLPPDLAVNISLNYMYPTGDLNDLTEPGLGFTMDLTMVRNNFCYGIESGLINFPGTSSSFDNMMMIPLFATAGYNLIIKKHIVVTPVLSAGPVYLNKDKTNGSSSAFEPGMKAGLKTSFIITNTIHAGLDLGYIHIFESNYHIAGISAGVGVTFLL